MKKLNIKFKIIRKTFYFLIVIFTFYFLIFNFSPLMAASTMESPQYIIQMPNINSGSDTYRSASATMSATLGQLAAEKFSSAGYLVRAGFQYYHSLFPFSFSISNTRVDFGEMTPNVPATASAILQVAFGGAGQYQVTAAEQGPLTRLGGSETIADTLCDSGPCDINTSQPWINASTTGFGYKMAGVDIPTTFTSCGDTCYRQFSDTVTIPVENPVAIMSSQNVTVDLSSKPKDIIHQSTITYKLNVSAIQAAGTYQTIIHYVATPSY